MVGARRLPWVARANGSNPVGVEWGFRTKAPVILSLSKDQPPENSRLGRKTVASSAVFPETRIVGELILRQAQDDGIFNPQVSCAKVSPTGGGLKITPTIAFPNGVWERGEAQLP
jgi:hypothetical protein